MDPYDFSALRRELVYQEFMIHYLQEEQKKRWEELRALERDLEKLRTDPKYQQLLKLVEKLKSEPVAEQVRARRSRAKRAKRSAVSRLPDSNHVDAKGDFFPK
jgi:biopolymer transport protein ExbB/TolQ